MQSVTLVKSAGSVTIVNILKCICTVKYGVDFLGSSSGFGAGSNELAIHIDDGASDVDAVAALAAAALPTCSKNLLDITVDAGTWIVADVTSITADAVDEKFVKVTIAVDDITGDPEVVVYEKTTGAYGDIPAGKTECGMLKEYSLPALGTDLTEINDWIK